MAFLTQLLHHRKQPPQFNVYRVRFLLNFLKFGLRKIEIDHCVFTPFATHLATPAKPIQKILIGVRVPPEGPAAIDAWIRKQKDRPSLSRPEAIRRLVELALKKG